MHPTQQHPQLEGLGDVIVTTQVQPGDDVHFLIRRGQKQDGHPGSAAHLPAEVEAGAVRQGHVQHQQVVAARLPQMPGLGQGTGRVQRITRPAQCKGQPGDQTFVILQQ